MKNLLTIKKIMNPKKEIVALILFLFLLKLSLAGYFLVKSGRLSHITFLDQAVAQEKALEGKGVEAGEGETDGILSGEEDFKSFTLLEKKKKDLEKKEEGLKQEEERLSQLKVEIEERLEKMALLEKKIEQLITLKESKEDKELTKLAKVFEATPPEQAGPMFNKLDVDIAAKILVRMKGRNAGKIWGFVNPDQAVKISNELAKLK
jgi:flagellar motility protein MotE (MotC chaperone)